MLKIHRYVLIIKAPSRLVYAFTTIPSSPLDIEWLFSNGCVFQDMPASPHTLIEKSCSLYTVCVDENRTFYETKSLALIKIMRKKN